MHKIYLLNICFGLFILVYTHEVGFEKILKEVQILLNLIWWPIPFLDTLEMAMMRQIDYIGYFDWLVKLSCLASVLVTPGYMAEGMSP